MPSPEKALVQRRIAALAGRMRITENRRRRREQWRAEGLSLWEQWRHDPLFLLGIGLYWGEGDKSPKAKRLALSNSDAGLLRVWLVWCRRFMPGVPLQYELHVHDTCDVQAARRFWKRELSIDVTWVIVAVSSASRRRRKCLPHGTLKIRVGRGSLEWF